MSDFYTLPFGDLWCVVFAPEKQARGIGALARTQAVADKAVAWIDANNAVVRLSTLGPDAPPDRIPCAVFQMPSGAVFHWLEGLQDPTLVSEPGKFFPTLDISTLTPAAKPYPQSLSDLTKLLSGASERGLSLPFIDNNDGTVTDTKTGLMWQKDDDGQSRHPYEARQYPRSLELAGYSDWRLPSEEELLSLWENAGAAKEVRERYFPSMRRSTYYCSATYVGGETEDWVSFDDGRREFPSGGFYHYVRCVRRGR
jgi:Protein of unknown function (DUF1566)